MIIFDDVPSCQQDLEYADYILWREVRYHQEKKRDFLNMTIALGGSGDLGLLLLSVPLWPRALAPVRIPSISCIDLFKNWSYSIEMGTKKKKTTKKKPLTEKTTQK